MVMNVENTKVMKISREPSPIQIMTDQNQLENVEYLNYLYELTNDEKCIWEIESRIKKAAFNK